MLFYLAAGLVVACIVLGGGTQRGFLTDVLLQLFAIPVFLVVLWKLLDVPWTKSTRAVLAYCSAVAVLPILQLIPLPPWAWSFLPGRAPMVATYQTVETSLPWMPISVAPESTALSALSILPPLTIFLATLLLSHRDRRRVSIAVLAIGVMSAVLGLIQVAQGPESALRFFEFTTPMDAVGFFANRNHFASFVFCLILFAAAWTAHTTLLAQGANRNGLDTGSIITAIASFALILLLLVSETMARSRAGLGLTMVAILGSFALGLSDRRARFLNSRESRTLWHSRLLLGATIFSAIFVIQFALYRILERFEDSIGYRVEFVWHTIEAAKAYMPFGSGLGTFIQVYAMFETPEDTAANTYANHAHNEILEIWLETGLPGLLLMSLFAYWLVTRAIQIWRAGHPGVRDIDSLLARAATIIVGLTIAHSLVDYPLRTCTMMAIFALACGLMCEPIIRGVDEEHSPRSAKVKPHRKQRSQPSDSVRRLASPVRLPSPVVEPPSIQAPPAQHVGIDTDIVWPQEWSNGSDSSLGDSESKKGPAKR
jgi:O-antigen ligase